MEYDEVVGVICAIEDLYANNDGYLTFINAQGYNAPRISYLWKEFGVDLRSLIDPRNRVDTSLLAVAENAMEEDPLPDNICISIPGIVFNTINNKIATGIYSSNSTDLFIDLKQLYLDYINNIGDIEVPSNFSAEISTGDEIFIPYKEHTLMYLPGGNDILWPICNKQNLETNIENVITIALLTYAWNKVYYKLRLNGKNIGTDLSFNSGVGYSRQIDLINRGIITSNDRPITPNDESLNIDDLLYIINELDPVYLTITALRRPRNSLIKKIDELKDYVKDFRTSVHIESAVEDEDRDNRVAFASQGFQFNLLISFTIR